jgi:hypothetical protein
MRVSDVLFVIVILAIIGLTITFLWKAVRAGYRRAMIEGLQGQMNYRTSSPRMQDTGVSVELEPFPQPKPEQKPSIGMYKVHMLAPSVAQYGKQNAVYIPTVEGIPASALPNVSMKDPWSFESIQAAEKPESEVCARSATGLFYECGVPSSNSLCN